MPSIPYVCDQCGAVKNKYVSKPKDIQTHIPCECGSLLKRQLSGFVGKSSVFTVDQGLPRAVEVNLEVIHSNKERSKKGENRGDW